MDQNQLQNTKAISRILIEDIAPQELPLFEYFIERFFEDTENPPSPFLQTKGTQVGGGLPGPDIVISYVIIFIVYDFVKSVVTGISEGLHEGIKDHVKKEVSEFLSKNSNSKKLLDKLEKQIRNKKINKAHAVKRLNALLEQLENKSP